VGRRADPEKDFTKRRIAAVEKAKGKTPSGPVGEERERSRGSKVFLLLRVGGDEPRTGLIVGELQKGVTVFGGGLAQRKGGQEPPRTSESLPQATVPRGKHSVFFWYLPSKRVDAKRS